MNLLLLKLSEINDTQVTLPAQDSRAKHIVKHLRKQKNDHLQVGVIDHSVGQAQIMDIKSGSVVLKLEYASQSILSGPSITVVLAMPFPKRLKALWPTISSFGVTRIVIVKATLCEAAFLESSVLSPSVYEPLLLEGMSQGCHTRSIQVDIRTDKELASVVDSLAGETKLFFDIDEKNPPVNALNAVENMKDSVCVAIGPERGWTDDEALLFRNHGFDAVSLGPSILRVDTAVIAALGLITCALDRSHGDKRKRKKRKHDETR